MQFESDDELRVVDSLDELRAERAAGAPAYFLVLLNAEAFTAALFAEQLANELRAHFGRPPKQPAAERRPSRQGRDSSGRQQLLVAQRPRGASRGAADKSWRSVRGVKEVTNIVKNSVSASVSGATHASFSGGALLGDAAVLQGTRLLLVFEALPADAVGAKSIDAIKDETPPDLRAELFNTIAMFLYHGHGESYERVSLEVLCAKLGGRLCKYRPEFHIEEKLHEITERFVATTRPKLARASSVHSSSGRSPELLRRDATTPKSKTKKAVSLQEQAIEIPCSAGSKR